MDSYITPYKPLPPQPTAEALKWRDLDQSDRNKEIGIRIAFVALSLLIAIGVAIAIYYCVTSTETVRFMGGGCGGSPVIPVEPFEQSLAPLAVIPGTFGFLGIVTPLMGACFYDREISVNGHASDLSKEETREEYRKQIQEKSLENMYNEYFKSSGGLGPLVRNAILTVEQGDQLRLLFKTMMNLKTLIMSSSEEVKTQLKESITKLDNAWTEMKKQLPGINNMNTITVN